TYGGEDLLSARRFLSVSLPCHQSKRCSLRQPLIVQGSGAKRITLLKSRRPEGDKRDQESSISRSSAFKDRTNPASALRIASARSRFVCCSSATFSSTVSRASRR